MLPLARSIGDVTALAYGLSNLACVAAARGSAAEAGVLWGAVEAQSEREPIRQWEQEREVYARRLDAMAGTGFEAGRARGRTLSLQQAVDHALAGRG
jgi:hypothetical protein